MATVNQDAEAKLLEALAVSETKMVPVQVEKEVTGRLPMDTTNQLYERLSKAAKSVNHHLHQGQAVPAHTHDNVVQLEADLAKLEAATTSETELAMISAYRRGRIDTALNTGSYVVLAFPAIVAVIAIVSFWGKSLFKITLVIGLFAAPLIFRVVRASTLSYATRDFVLAAKALGASDTRILTREILPNIMPTIVSFGLIAVATIIVLEGSLAFLGLSVSPPTPSWGNMLNEGSSLLTGAKGQTNPWLVIFPASAMFLLLISLNVVADKLRAYFDVSEIKL